MISHSFGFIDMICSSFFLLLLLDLLITKIHTRNGATEILYQRFVLYMFILYQEKIEKASTRHMQQLFYFIISEFMRQSKSPTRMKLHLLAFSFTVHKFVVCCFSKTQCAASKEQRDSGSLQNQTKPSIIAVPKVENRTKAS